MQSCYHAASSIKVQSAKCNEPTVVMQQTLQRISAYKLPGTRKPSVFHRSPTNSTIHRSINCFLPTVNSDIVRQPSKVHLASASLKNWHILSHVYFWSATFRGVLRVLASLIASYTRLERAIKTVQSFFFYGITNRCDNVQWNLFLCKSTLHVSGGTHAHHQEYNFNCINSHWYNS